MTLPEAPTPPSAPRRGIGRGAMRPMGGPARVPTSGAPPASAPPIASALLALFPVGLRVVDGYLALAAMAHTEAYVIGLLHLRRFVASYEFNLATTSLDPISYLVAAPCAVVAGCVIELLRHGEGRGGRIAASVTASLFTGAVAYGVLSGRHFEGGLRAPLSAGLALIGGAAAFAIAPTLARWIAPPRTLGRAAGFLAVVLAVVVLLDVTNLGVLPRLYPPFHLGLAALTVLAGAAGGLAFGVIDAPLRALVGLTHRRELVAIFSGALLRTIGALAVFALGAAGATGAARRLARRDNVRLIYHERSPLLTHVVRIASEIAPPPPIEDSPATPALASGHEVDLSGWDLLLITVDALRADHVGFFGYPRATTPNLDRLAASGVAFEAAYSPTPHTSYAVTSIMTGKYMRPLILQGMGDDSDTWASHLRRYGYRTAAFYPPAVFFIDAEHFTRFRESALDFEYRRIEFASAAERPAAVRTYLERQPKDRHVFLWVHLFEPHEPYEAHDAHPFGDRDIDRYDSEIAAADDGIGALVTTVRSLRPRTVVMVTADHGEEFSEHGGRYHGTTVYEEQVRVPLVVNAPGLFPAHRVAEPVQVIDLLPTVLASLDVPRPARVRGADLGPLLVGQRRPAPPIPSPALKLDGFAFSETDSQTLLARGNLRLVCARRIGACALYDLEKDPREQVDASSSRPGDLSAMRAELRAVEASHGRYERQGLRNEGKGWPEALRRGLAGDGDAAIDVAGLLDDADVGIRRKSAEVLFALGRKDASAQLRLSLARDEDEEVRRWAALALTRMGEGAPKVRDLLTDGDVNWRRLAALALAEQGDSRGEPTLTAWLREAFPAKPEATRDNPSPKAPVGIAMPFDRAREVIAAIARIRAKSATINLIAALEDVRLRPYVAHALAQVGEEAARPALTEKLASERFQLARSAIAEALVALGAGPELRVPLVRFLGTPDPLPDGVKMATEAKVIDLVGGPREKDRDRLRRFATSGVAVGVVIPKLSKGDRSADGDSDRAQQADGLRVLCRARSTDRRAGEIRVGTRLGLPPATLDRESLVPRRAPELDRATTSVLAVPAVDSFSEPFATVPKAARWKAGEWAELVVYATQNVEVSACVVVPLSEELPPPPPEPWTPVEVEK